MQTKTCCNPCECNPVENEYEYECLSTNSAWECTRCNKVNAPHVDQCNCKPYESCCELNVSELQDIVVEIVVDIFKQLS